VNPTLTINRMDSPTFKSAAYISIIGETDYHAVRSAGREAPAIRVICQNSGQVQGEWVMKIASMTQLKEGWNGYHAPPPSARAIGMAENFLAHLLGKKIEPSRLAPSAVGGVGLTRRKNDRRVYVEFFNNGRIYALFSDSVTEPISREVPPGRQGFLKLIGDMGAYLDA
jgi:hypothetical protein